MSVTKVVPYVQDPTTGVVYLNTREPAAISSPPLNPRSSRAPSPTYSTVTSPETRWPQIRGRSPSPRRSVRSESNWKTAARGSERGHHSRQTSTRHGSAYYAGKTYQGSAWSQRRPLALLWGLLLLALLAGVAAGIYFLVRYAEAQAASNAPNVRYPGGYYVNGIYVITSTLAPSESRGIIGHDRNCNPYNNNTEASILRPNCSDITTTVVPIKHTTTPDPAAVTLSHAPSITYWIPSVIQLVLLQYVM